MGMGGSGSDPRTKEKWKMPQREEGEGGRPLGLGEGPCGHSS